MTDTPILPTDAAARKQRPVFSGCLQYFPRTLRTIAEKNGGGCYTGLVAKYPRALAAISHLSWVGNEQHNPGQHLHWDKSKSADELDALTRHLIEDERVHVAWRACANCERAFDRTPNLHSVWALPEKTTPNELISELMGGNPINAVYVALEWLEQSLRNGWEPHIVLPTAQNPAVSSDNSTVDKPDRDCAMGEGDCEHLVPAGLPPLPEGWVYYGMGPLRSHAYASDTRDVMSYCRQTHIWLMGSHGRNAGIHYALRKGSSIAKTNGFA